MKLIPVKYHKKDYPDPIRPLLIELAGNLDSKPIDVDQPYSLHTEYSYMKRKLDSELLVGLEELRNANHNGIPQLWKSEQWSIEYAYFIERLIGSSIPPEVIEIHPPFLDYCSSLSVFWERYLIFYREIKEVYPDTTILIENRCGTTYSKSNFLLSTCGDMLEFCRFLADGHRELGLIVDYPQLFSAEKIKMDQVKLDKILQFNRELKPYVDTVGAIHLWGKQKRKSKTSGTSRWTPHCGDLNTFFSGEQDKKAAFLTSVKDTFDDQKERYFVPEVNTTEEDLQSIIQDMVSAGITFVQAALSHHLIAIDWEEGGPQFVLQDHSTCGIVRQDAIGNFSFSVGAKQYCIGNRDIMDHRLLGCPDCSEVTGSSRKCEHCQLADRLKACVRCTGESCPVTDRNVLERCAQEHVIYLAYFPHNTVKVGVAHSRRKYIRLYEQGALYAQLVFSCTDGKIARQFESLIRMTGIKDKITSSYKMQNLVQFDLAYAQETLAKVRRTIVDRLPLPKGVFTISPPEEVMRTDVLKVLKEIPVGYQQLTLWGDAETEAIEATVLDTIDGFQGEIREFAGSIAIMRQKDHYYLFDFKKILGREFLAVPWVPSLVPSLL